MIRAVIQLEIKTMINNTPMVIIFVLMTAPASVSGCVIHPTSVVVTADERVLLTCTTYEGGSISSLHIPINILEKIAIFTAPVYKQDGTIRKHEKVAEGYFVTHPADNETTLQMKKIILSQAGLYVCTCDLQSTAASTVVVLDFEPKFTTNHIGADGEPVNFSCSLSFNASSDVSCELMMEDPYGYAVARRCKSTLNNDLIVCNLEHTIIANASSDQWHTCKVTLSTGEDMIYSRALHATVEWPSTTSTTVDFSNGGAQAERGEVVSQKIAIGLSVGLLAISVLFTIIVVYFYIRSKNRKKLSSQTTDQSSNRPQRPAVGYDKNNIGSLIPNDVVKSCSKAAAHQDKKALKESALILCENDLYSATSKRLDPSDGYYPDEVIYAQVNKPLK